MYNPTILRAEFANLVGISQGYLPQTPAVLSPLTISESGIFHDDKNSLCSTDNIFFSAPDFNPNIYTAWATATLYPANRLLSYQGKIYKTVNQITSSVPPPSDVVNYVIDNPFQNFLQKKYNQASTNLFSEVVKIKKLQHMGKAVLESINLYRLPASRYNTELKNGRAVGFRIDIEAAEGLLLVIKKLGVQFQEAQVGMKFYLYHSEQKAPIYVWEKDVPHAYSFSWLTLADEDGIENAVLNYNKYNSGGYYIFMYYENDLVGNAITREWSPGTTVSCRSCNGDDLLLYNLWSRYSTFTNMHFDADDLNVDRSLPDVSKIKYNSTSNWGMNFGITVKCDLTDTIVSQKFQMADAFAMQLCREFLDVIAKSNRKNPDGNEIKNKAAADLDEKFPGSWIRDYKKSIEAINLDLSGFSNACMKTDTRRNISWGSVG